MDPFEAFESNTAATESDPAAEFLAREQAELEKIENNDFSNDFSGFAPAETQENAFTEEPKAASAPSSNDLYSAISSADQLTQEPEKIKKWREEQKKRIETKDAEEELKKKEWKEAAKKELDDWYKNRQEQLVKTRENNKAAEAELNAPYDSNAKNVEWDRIAKHCDFNPKANKNTRDVGRMRSILLQLKQTPLVR